MDQDACSFDSICCVCLEELPIVRQVSGLDCIHREMFHVHCIETWLTTKRSCPLCRTEIIVQFEIEEEPAYVPSLLDDSQSVPKTIFVLSMTILTFLLGIYNLFYLLSSISRGANFILSVIQFMYSIVIFIFLYMNIAEMFVSRVLQIQKLTSVTVFINTGFVYSVIIFFNVIYKSN